jgi:hypothetical protein
MINQRIDELQNMRKEVQDKELIYEDFYRRVQLKREIIENKNREIEIKEKEYLLRYQVYRNFYKIVSCRKL